MGTDRDTRERLLDAAGPVFAERGFQAATVREICQKAGVNVASVNYHFGDKEKLYYETVMQARQQRARKFPFPDWTEETPADRKLCDFVETLLNRMLRPEMPWQSRLMMREVLDPTAVCQDLMREFFRPQFELLMSILAELIGQETPSFVLRRIAFSVMGQCLLYRVAGKAVKMLTPEDEHEQFFDIPELAQHISYLSLAACGHRPPFNSQQAVCLLQNQQVEAAIERYSHE